MELKINIPGFREIDGMGPIVILGPNGSGKTKLAQRIAAHNNVSSISAQRRTWLDDSLPVQEEKDLTNNAKNHIDRWRSNAWQPTEEINFVMSGLIQDHANQLTRRNEEAMDARSQYLPVTDTKLILLQQVWLRLYPQRKLEIGGYFPRVLRLDQPGSEPYRLRDMSDGERTVLYMAARVLTSTASIILIDEPELHLHSRLATQFWDEAEKLRPDCRFVYVTHDLNLALSRRGATVLLSKPDDSAECLLLDDLPASVAAEVVGAATLPFYAKRIIFYEGEAGRGFASELLDAWFSSDETFAIPAGNRDSVMEAVSGLRTVGLAAAEVIGLVDRDYYSDESIAAASAGVQVLALHEIESVLCDRAAIAAIAVHIGKDPDLVFTAFHDRVKQEFRGQSLNAVAAKRVRAQLHDWLSGAFTSEQIVNDAEQTKLNHHAAVDRMGLPDRAAVSFDRELERVRSAIDRGQDDMLALIPGKHLAALVAQNLGLKGLAELTGLVVGALRASSIDRTSPLCSLGDQLGAAFGRYLPARRSA